MRDILLFCILLIFGAVGAAFTDCIGAFLEKHYGGDEKNNTGHPKE